MDNRGFNPREALTSQWRATLGSSRDPSQKTRRKSNWGRQLGHQPPHVPTQRGHLRTHTCIYTMYTDQAHTQTHACKYHIHIHSHTDTCTWISHTHRYTPLTQTHAHFTDTPYTDIHTYPFHIDTLGHTHKSHTQIFTHKHTDRDIHTSQIHSKRHTHLTDTGTHTHTHIYTYIHTPHIRHPDIHTPHTHFTHVHIYPCISYTQTPHTDTHAHTHFTHKPIHRRQTDRRKTLHPRSAPLWRLFSPGETDSDRRLSLRKENNNWKPLQLSPGVNLPPHTEKWGSEKLMHGLA